MTRRSLLLTAAAALGVPVVAKEAAPAPKMRAYIGLAWLESEFSLDQKPLEFPVFAESMSKAFNQFTSFLEERGVECWKRGVANIPVISSPAAKAFVSAMHNCAPPSTWTEPRYPTA